MDRILDAVDYFMEHHARKTIVILVVLATAIIIGAGVVRANKGQSLISYEQVTEDNEIRITAEDAMEGMGEYRWGKLIVDSGQSIVIESKLEEAGIRVSVFHNAMESYKETIEGTQSIEVKVEPGTYEIGTLPEDGATGTMTISAR